MYGRRAKDVETHPPTAIERWEVPIGNVIGSDHGVGCKRDFVVTVYEVGHGGAQQPLLPLHCPFGGDGASCRVGVHCRRERKQGPGFALAVAVCHEHRRYFTLYPPGWTPWGRTPVCSTTAQGRTDWATTLFVAALDAAAGDLWPVESCGALGCAKTQARWIHRGARWLGVAGTERATEAAASVLDLPLSELVRARSQFAGAGRRRGGRALEPLLQQRAWAETDLRRLLVVGGRAGVCGRAWITGQGGVVQPVFRASERPEPGH